MKSFISWLVKRALSGFVTGIFILMSIVGVVYALNFPSGAPDATQTIGGKFTTYFNSIRIACPAGQYLNGYDTNFNKICATAPAGPTGPAGATGPAGPTGLTGLQGPAGATWPQWPAGPSGAGGASCGGIPNLTVYSTNPYNSCLSGNGGNSVYQCQNGTIVWIGTIPGWLCWSP